MMLKDITVLIVLMSHLNWPLKSLLKHAIQILPKLLSFRVYSRIGENDKAVNHSKAMLQSDDDFYSLRGLALGDLTDW